MRWRPIQLFLSLTDNLEPNTGGFECVKGFHKQFYKYFANKNSNNIIDSNNNNNNQVCVGDFIRLLPKEDETILNQFKHISYKKGSLILFDWRTPHANARFNKSENVRKVIYTGFLPNVPLNQQYAKQQLDCFLKKTVPPDFWGNEHYTSILMNSNSNNFSNLIENQINPDYTFTKLGKKLMGIEEW